jgi:hypothetical protein
MSDEQEEQIIAWENLEMEQVAAISEAVAVSNTITVFWRYCTGIDADTEQASASIPYTNGFHKVIEEDNEGVVYIQGNEASFASDEEDAFDNFLDGDKEIIEDRSVFFD